MAARQPKEAIVPITAARTATILRRTIDKSRTSATNADTITSSSGISGIIQSKDEFMASLPSRAVGTGANGASE